MKKGTLFIVSAPSGAGKTSLTNYVVKALSPQYTLSKIITYTTRPARAGEIAGIDYHFVSPVEFERIKKAGEFLETTEYNGNSYGSPLSILTDLKNGKSFLLVLDRAGANHIKSLVENPILIWLTVPDAHTLQERIIHRGTESPQVLEQRLLLAQQEMCDEERDQSFAYHVVNNDFEQAAQEIIAIIKNTLTR